ncbi:MAG: DNA polymerase III subunit alpha, partial [Myxococcales bacterium]|nr:DNA polymerase III subunit alpha [Myxococcales bacterium]
FAPGDFYLELMPTPTPEQTTLNGELVRMGKKLGIPLVATNDCHYVNQTDAQAHDVLMAIQTGKSLKDEKRLKHVVDSYYMKSPSEMDAHFKDVPEAIENTAAIAARCNVKLKLDQTYLPKYQVPEGETLDTYIEKLVVQGLDRRFREMSGRGQAFDPDQYRERCRVEMAVIQKMGFSGYFLIVWDFINWAKEHGIPVGPGRGSGAGSAVAWALRITDIDPIEFKLLFERFLNPERVSMPDFDVDFCMNRRGEVISYVQEKYGRDRVGQIATFHQLKARGVIRDIARAMEIPFAEADKLAKLVPEPVAGKSPPVREAIEQTPELKQLYNESPLHRELLDLAASLEGLNRNAGMHAAGVVIAEKPLWEYVPCFRGQNDEIVTQFAMKEVEKAGLVKFDFLGLKTLTVIDIAERLVNKRPDVAASGHKFEVNKVPLDDAGTFALLQSGETTGVFQLESSGMQQLFKDLRPDAFEDIVAAVALYRPGPLGTGMVKDFVDCKHGRKPIQKMHPLVDEILVPTYGVIVYQEQVMQVAQKLAGYSLGGADLLRRAMGKKKPEEMAKQKATFVEGSVNNGVTIEDAERIFGLLEFFAGYGFNKSHSAAYALLTYQTAYLKAHYPVEFLCALMTADRDKIEKVVRIIAEGRAWGVETLPPEVNQSQIDFTVVYADPNAGPESRRGGKARRGGRRRDPYDPKIRFGLGAIRGVGESALEAILEARGEGAFKDLFDLAERVDPRRVNKGVLESLVASGAFDATLTERGISRAQAFGAIDSALERGRSASKDRERGQTNLFGLFAAAEPEAKKTNAEYPNASPWDLRETLVREKEALGFYVSGHPLERYGVELSRFDVTPTAQLMTGEPWAKVRACGMVEGWRVRIFKGGGGKVAFFTLEDTSGRIEVKVRERQIDAYESVLTSGEPVLVNGKLSFPFVEEGEEESGPREPTLLLDEAVLFTDALRAEAKSITLRLSAARHTPAAVERLKGVLEGSPGACSIILAFELEGGAEATMTVPSLRVEPSDQMFGEVEKLLGGKAIELR